MLVMVLAEYGTDEPLTDATTNERTAAVVRKYGLQVFIFPGRPRVSG